MKITKGMENGRSGRTTKIATTRAKGKMDVKTLVEAEDRRNDFGGHKCFGGKT